MRGVICCIAAAFAVAALTAATAVAGPGRGAKHVTVLRPDGPPAAAHSTGAGRLDVAGSLVALRNAHDVGVSDANTASGVRELLTLSSPKAPHQFLYDLQLGEGMTAAQLGSHAVAFVQNGAQVAAFVAPAMTDASGAISRSIEVRLHGNTISVEPDAAWLATAAYPVTVDPDVWTFQGANQDTYITSGSPDGYFAGDPQLLVGNDGTQVYRGLLNFQVDTAIPAGATIDKAQLSLNLESGTAAPVVVANATAPWNDATWRQYDSNWPSGAPLLWTTPGGDTDSVGAATGTTAWDVTQLVQREVSGAVGADGFLLSAQDETATDLLHYTSTYSWNGNPWPTLVITWEDGGSASTPAVSIPTGNSVNFGTQWVGKATPSQEVDVQNSGSAPLTVSSLAIGGANRSDFAITNQTCTGSSIQPGASCAITLVATPGAVGNRTGTLTITDDAPNSPQSVALSVNGQVSVSATYAPTGGISFPTVRVGTTTGTKYVTIKSTGQSPLSVSSTSLTGTYAGDFAIVSNSCTGRQLSSGQSCTIGIRARPSGRGGHTATLVIADNDANGGASLPLTAYGY
jgi:hypothetical protein